MKKLDENSIQDNGGFKYRLDPNRVRTKAEIRLFADVFGISIDEARSVLTRAGRKCEGNVERENEGGAYE